MVYYQRTENVPIGQWLACHWKTKGLKGLQSGCCLRCLFQRLEALRLDQAGCPSPLCIIAAGSRNPDVAIRHRHRPQLPAELAISSISPSAGSSNIVAELDAFFRQDWVITLLANTAFHVRNPKTKPSVIESTLRHHPVYLWIKAAFVIEALGDGSSLRSAVRSNRDDLMTDWNKLRDWLKVRSLPPEVVVNVHIAMERYRQLSSIKLPATAKGSRWDGPWGFSRKDRRQSM
jgi:hypothetical protein